MRNSISEARNFKQIRSSNVPNEPANRRLEHWSLRISCLFRISHFVLRAFRPRSTVRIAVRLHHNERGTISIVSVFAMLLLAMLLGMVLNVGRHVDGKIKMQNAADAATYSGGVVLARGMNTLAFTNHLLCDVFALTAFMREARDGNAASFAPPILAAWAEIGPVFASSGFE